MSSQLNPIGGKRQERPPIAVAVVNSNPVMRQSFGNLLSQQPELHLAGLYAGIAELVERAPADELILIYDLETAHREGAPVVMTLQARLPRAKILMMNVSDNDEAIIEATRAGAAGCVLEDVSFEDLMIAIRSLADGSLPASPRVITSLYNYIASHQREDERIPGAELTPREQQILELIAQGLSNKEIAGQLLLRPQTVKNYVRMVFEKLGVHSRLDVMRLLKADRNR
jgi:two-component system, NarL family, response regulator DevR